MDCEVEGLGFSVVHGAVENFVAAFKARLFGGRGADLDVEGTALSE